MQMTIHQKNNKILATSKCYRLAIDISAATARLMNSEGNLLFDFPVGVRISTTEKDLYSESGLTAQIENSCIILHAKNSIDNSVNYRFVFDIQPDSFTFSCRVTVNGNSSLCPGKIEYFRDAELGMRLNTMIEGFCVPKSPMSCEEYYNIFPLVSTEGLATPPVLNIGMKFYHGFVGIGLLDYSNATTFGVSSPFMGLIVDALGHNVKFHPGEVYQGPEVIFTFPLDGWDGITSFRNKLKEKNRIFPERSKIEWWKRPMCCTYGDQIMAYQPVLYSDIYWDSPHYTQEWVRQFVLNAEYRLDYREFTVVIDAFWQRRWDTDPIGDPTRFPKIRELIAWMHSRGHKVLLWYSPHFVNVHAGYGEIARKYDMIGRYMFRHDLFHPSELGVIDYTADNAADYLKEIAEKLFDDGNLSLDADGVKLDFLAAIPPTELSAGYINPHNGMGLQMIRRYLNLFSSVAKAIKPDVLLNYSSSDPQVSHLVDMNRLHDIKINPQERERRARISALACPNTIIDSDGAVMMSDWAAGSYICAAIYSTPALYYTEIFNDGQRWPDDKMKTLGKLFKMCQSRFWGTPEFVSYGNWRLRDENGQVVSESYDGEICWIKTGVDKINLISFEDKTATINLHGFKPKSINPLPESPEISGYTITARWKDGIMYEIK